MKLLQNIITFTLIGILFSNCQKETIKSIPPLLETKKQVATENRYSTTKNVPVDFILENKYGVAVSPKIRSSIKSSLNYQDCDLDIGDNLAITYTGATISAYCAFTTYDIFVSWNVVIPEDVVLNINSLSKGRWRLSTSDPYQNSTLYIGTPSAPYLNTTTGQNVRNVPIYFSFTLNNSDFCSHNNFYVNFIRVGTDCDDLSLISTSAVSDVFDPEIYTVPELFALNFNGASGTHNMEIYPLYVLCTICHSPTLGITSDYKFSYRLQGASTWVETIITGLGSTYLSVPSAGTYEYKSKGKLKADGTFTEYSGVRTCIVN